MAKIKQSFQALGAAIESGDLSAAKEALAGLQENAPDNSGNRKDPIGTKIAALSEAVESGDVAASKQAYADLKESLTKKASGDAPAGGGSGGPPAGGGAPPSGGGAPASVPSKSPNSNKVYDKMDANKDGTVSWKEEQDYYRAHPNEKKDSATTSPNKVDSERGMIDALA